MFMKAAKICGKAVVSVILGVIPITGVGGIILGVAGVREINASEGRLRGRRLALAGMIAGGAGTLLLAAAVGAFILTIIRGGAEKLTCQNNLRVIGGALNAYQDKNKAYPWGTLPLQQLEANQRLSWYVELLPFLDKQSLYEKFDLGQGWETEANQKAVRTPVQGFRCPTNQGGPDGSTLTEYVGITGVGKGAALLPGTDPRAGVFGYDRRTPVKEISRGVGYTMMATETAWENGPWAAGGNPTLREVIPDQIPYIGEGRPFGGLHRGGLYVLYVDGKVTFVMKAVDAKIFEDQARIHVGE